MSGAAEAGISVVIPARNSGDQLPGLFESLDRARAELAEQAKVPSEVVLVDDSTRDRDEVERLCERHGVRLVRAGRHVGGKRNRGAAAARFDVLLFVDSDCRASPGLLVEHWQTHRDHPDGAGAGPVEFFGARSWLWPGIEASPFIAPYRLPATSARLLWAVTANLSVPRARFEAIGGFDESSPVPLGAEDVDLGLRLSGQGCPIHGNPRAVVRHSTATWNSARAMVRRVGRWGWSEPWLILQHPRRVYVAFPGHLTTAVAGLVVWSAVGLLGRGRLGAVLPALWLAAYLVTWLLRRMRRARMPLRRVHVMLVSSALSTVYGAGRLAACWARRRPDLTTRRMGAAPGMAVLEWGGATLRGGAWAAASLLCALVWIVAAR